MTHPTLRRPAWARKGTDVSGLSFEDALVKAGIAYDVKACPAYARIPIEGQDDHVAMPIRDRQHTYRTDTLEPLGEVGQRYHVVNTRQCGDLVEEIVGGGWQPEFAGPLNGGRAVFIVGKLPFETSNEIDPYLALVNSFDGSTGIRLANTPVRPACTNAVRRTFKAARSAITLRHTVGATARAAMVREALGLSRAYYEKLDQEIEQLMRVELDDKRLKMTLDLLYEFKPSGDKDVDEKRREANQQNRQAFVAHLDTSATIPDTWRRSAWGVLNATTEMEQWFGRNTGSEKYAENLLGAHIGLVPTVTKSDRMYKLVTSWS